MERRSLLSALVVVVLASACKTAAPPPPPRAVGASDPLRVYVGELRLLRHDGRDRAVRLSGLSRLDRGCTVAVHIRGAALVGETASFFLETLGTPRLRDRTTRCGRMQPQLELTISGFSPNPFPSEAAARVDGVLLTPEAYLASQGVRFGLPPGEAPSEAACREAFATQEEIRLARRVTAWPVPLLSVDPWVPAPRRRMRQQSEIRLDAVVGVDGRLHRPHLRTGLGEDHASIVLRSLSFWRFRPARGEEGRLPARVALRPVLHTY